MDVLEGPLEPPDDFGQNLAEEAQKLNSTGGGEKKSFLGNGIYGRVLEEVDPFVFDDTFCVLVKKFRKTFVTRYSASRSLFIFSPLNILRRFCICVISNQLFDLFIIITIISNCVALATDSKLLGRDKNGVYVIVDQELPKFLEWTFLIIYTLEFGLKVIAKGFFFNKYSYLRNGWNLLDFIVVACGYLTEFFSSVGLSGRSVMSGEIIEILRTFRVLRAVKTISIIPGLRVMINALMNAITQLLEVMLLTFFCLCIFSLFALEIFMGKFHQICVLVKGSPSSQNLATGLEILPISPLSPTADDEYKKWVQNPANWLMRSYPQDEFVVCSNDTGGRHCPEDYVCIGNLGENPDKGWTSFDHFGLSMLSTLQLITLDYWERLYELVISSVGPWCIIFFVGVIFFGSFYLLNLMLAVVAMSYESEASSWEMQPLTKHQKLSLHRSHSTFSFDEPSKLEIRFLTKSSVTKTPAERLHLAKTLRNATTKRKKRKAFRRKPPKKTSTNEDDDNFTPLQRPPSTHKALMSGVLGERSIKPKKNDKSAVKKKKQSPPGVSFSIEQESVKNEIENINKNLGEYLEEEDKSSSKKKCLKNKLVNEESSNQPDITRVKIPMSVKIQESNEPIVTICENETNKTNKSGGVRISARVKSVKNEDESETKRFYLEMTDEPKYYQNIAQEGERSNRDEEANKEHPVQVLNPGSKTNRNRRQFYPKFTSPSEKLSGTKKLLSELKSKLDPIVEHWAFESFITTCIIINTSLLASEHYLQPLWLTETISIGSHCFTAVFTIECILKITALQKDYFKQFWNIFDLVTVIVSFVDIFLDIIIDEGGFAFRVVRLLRIFKLAQSWITMKVLLNIIFSTFGALGNLTLILVIFIYIFAILGMQILGDRFTPQAFEVDSPDDDDFPRWHFQDFWHAFMMIFRVISQEWIEPLSDCLDAHEDGQEWRCFVIYIPCLIFGTFIVLNLFLALLLNSFNSEELKAQRDKEKELTGKSDKPDNFKSLVGLLVQKTGTEVVVAQHRDIIKEEKPIIIERSSKSDEIEDCLPHFLTNLDCYVFNKMKRLDLGKWTSFRVFCHSVVSNFVFEWGILVLILASSLTLCFEDVYLEENPVLKLTLFILNCLFTTIFVIEMILKWFALGLTNYFTSFWTVLDVFIVSVSVVTLGFDIQNRGWEPVVGTKKSAVSSLKALRTLRALRPLRAISRWQGMKVVVNALLYAIPSIFNVLLVCLLFWLVFAIMGVQFFKGKFFKCIYAETGSLVPTDLVDNKTQCCARSDTVWINTTPNFDNVFEAYLSLFQVATFEGWMELMRAASDMRSGYDNQPRRDESYYANIYFVIFIIFGTFFTLNLFIGVIIDNFNMLKKKYEGNLVEALLTPSQMRYYTAMKKLGRKKPQRVIRRPLNQCLALFYDISMSRRFEIAIFSLIFLNMVIMAFEHHDQREVYNHVLTGFNSFFSTIYALEAIVKIIGMRHYYFTIPWNVFDFGLVLFSIMDLFLTDVEWSLPFPPTMLRVIRVFRIGRVLRLIKAAKGIRKLLFALIVSLPALFNIGALLALITFIYGILGVALFKDAPLSPPMDEMFNFKTFPRSSMLLLRLMTGAGWNDVLSSLTVEIPECGDGSYKKLSCDENECGSRLVPVLYLVSFIIITNLIVINMYIAIILENFLEANQEEEIGIVEDDLEMFYIRWSRYDPTATQFIGFEQLSEFLACLDPPLEVPRPNIVAIVSFNLPIARGNKIHCLDILHALVKHALGHVDDSEEFRKVQEQMETKFKKQFPSRKLLDIISSTRIWKIQHNAAIKIQREWRSYRCRILNRSEEVKSTQTVKSGGGFGHKLGAFFHVGTNSRRRSSMRDSPLLPHRKRESRRDFELSPSRFRSSLEHSSIIEKINIESEDSSPNLSSSPLFDSINLRNSLTRAPSPSRLSGGSFDAALHFGSTSTNVEMPMNSQLLSVHMPQSVVNKGVSLPETSLKLSEKLSESSSHLDKFNIVPNISKLTNHPQCINYTTSPLTSTPTTPSSPT